MVRKGPCEEGTRELSTEERQEASRLRGRDSQLRGQRVPSFRAGAALVSPGKVNGAEIS